MSLAPTVEKPEAGNAATQAQLVGPPGTYLASDLWHNMLNRPLSQTQKMARYDVVMRGSTRSPIHLVLTSTVDTPIAPKRGIAMPRSLLPFLGVSGRFHFDLRARRCPRHRDGQFCYIYDEENPDKGYGPTQDLTKRN